MPFTKTEIEQAVKSLCKKSSPGIDGLPAEFYRALWPTVGDFCVISSKKYIFRRNCPGHCLSI